MKHFFLTFADSRFYQSMNRLQAEAADSGFFDRVIATDEYDLDPQFVARFHDKLTPSVRGFGYWSWKPQIILQCLDEMADGDMLVYADSGCLFNNLGISRLREYFALADNPHGILVFQLPENYIFGSTDCITVDAAWCKGDLLDLFGVRDRDDIILSGQNVATSMVIKKCRASVDLIKQWQNIYVEDFSLIDDSPSRSENHSIYCENRHDQAILSLLCKTQGVTNLQNYADLYIPEPFRFALNNNQVEAKAVFAAWPEPILIIGRKWIDHSIIPFDKTTRKT